MVNQGNESFAESAISRLRSVGISDAEIVARDSVGSDSKNAEVIIRSGLILLRFIRDRGQEFLDLGSVAAPNSLFQFCDVEIAMGWKTIDEVLAMREPDRIDVVLAKLALHFMELSDAFCRDRERLTRARVERAARDRGEAFVKRLRAKKDDPLS